MEPAETTAIAKAYLSPALKRQENTPERCADLKVIHGGKVRSTGDRLDIDVGGKGVLMKMLIFPDL